MHKKHILKIEPYKPGKPIQEVQREYGLRKIIKLASNENPLGPSPKAITAMGRYVSQVDRYPEGSCHDLRNKLALQWGFHKDQYVFGNGSNELLVMLGLAYLKPGDETVFSSESFVVYRMVTALMGARARIANARQHAHDLPAMARLLSHRTMLLFLCNPNNPTGTILRRRELRSFMRDIPTGCVTVFDEAYAEYVTDPEYGQGMAYVRRGANAIVLRTFSKCYGLAGMRIGYGIAPVNVVQALELVRQPFNVSSMAQTAALAALDDRAFLTKVRRVNEKGKRYLICQFQKMGLDMVPTYANFILFRTQLSSEIVYEHLLRKGVIVRPIDAQYLRVTIGKDAENRIFIYQLRKVLGFKPS